MCRRGYNAVTIAGSMRHKMLSRREFGNAVSLALTTFAASGFPSSDALAQTADPKAAAAGGDKRLQIAALVYPNMILLDLAGPMTAFNIMRADIHLVAKTMAPIATDVGIALMRR
jgi:cyclohexyl-isocyanide hydratase